MRLTWAIVAGLAAGIALAWWLSREPPAVVEARRTRAEQAAAANAHDARPVLYRWTDRDGVLQVSDTPPPAGVQSEKVDLAPRDGIDIRGDRAAAPAIAD